MKKFKFSLQTIHRVREMKSEREALVLNELRKEADAAARQVVQIENLRNQAVESYVQRLNAGGTLDPREMELNSRHFESLNALQREAEKTAEEKRAACARQIERLNAARIEVKVTDKLRDNQERRFMFQLEQTEQRNIDELVTTKFARRVQGTK